MDFIHQFYCLGYYRVNYDNDTWTAIANVLNTSHTKIHALNRAQVVLYAHKSFNLNIINLPKICIFFGSKFWLLNSDC